MDFITLRPVHSGVDTKGKKPAQYLCDSTGTQHRLPTSFLRFQAPWDVQSEAPQLYVGDTLTASSSSSYSSSAVV
jgi:hypothetical protein